MRAPCSLDANFLHLTYSGNYNAANSSSIVAGPLGNVERRRFVARELSHRYRRVWRLALAERQDSHCVHTTPVAAVIRIRVGNPSGSFRGFPALICRKVWGQSPFRVAPHDARLALASSYSASRLREHVMTQ